MKTVKCYEASDGKLFRPEEFEDYKMYEKSLRMEDYFAGYPIGSRKKILNWVGSDHFYEVFPLYKDLGVTTQNVGD